MADLNQIEQALRAADAAGNHEDAKRLAQAYATARAQQPQPAQAPPAPQQGGQSTLGDVLHSIPGGIAKGVAGIVGLPGDVNNLMDAGADWVAGKLGADPQVLSGMQQYRQSRPLRLPTSDAVNKTISQPFGGYYQPQTKAGQYAETVASFAPNALLPGSAAARIARTVVPGVASEAAGQAVKGSKWEPLARAGGALAGGLGVGAVEGMMSKSPVPSLEELGQMKNNTYKLADQAGVVIAPDSFQKFATDLGADFTKNNVVQADLHKNALSALSVIQDEAASGQPLSLGRADAIRQVVNNAIESAGNNNGGDMRLAQKIKGAFDSYLDNLSPSDTLSGDPEVAVPILKDARALAQREFKAKEIQKVIDLAENQAAGNNSALGRGQALRQQFKNLNATLIKDPTLAKSFSPAERAAIETVVRGGPVENALRLFGKLAPTNAISMGVGPSLGATVGAAIGGPVGAGIGAVGVPALGAAARGGASLMTGRNAEAAAALMRAGQSAPPSVTMPQLLGGMLFSQAAHR